MAAISRPNPEILVTGATGALGPRIIEGLHASGYRLRVLALAPPVSEEPWPSIDVRIGDINCMGQVRSALEGSNYVVHMAAMLHVRGPQPYQAELYERINVEGTKNVVTAAMEAGVEKFILFSTVAVYGHTVGNIINEDTAPNPATFYAQSKLRAERIVLDARKPDGKPFSTVLRLAATYGSRVKGNYRSLVRALSKRIFVPIGQGANRRTLIYDKDVAKAVLTTLESPNTAGKIFNVTDGDVHTMEDIIATICKALGRKRPWVRFPVLPLRAGATVADAGARLARLRPRDIKGALDKYVEDLAVDGLRIQRETGFRPDYNLLSGWTETVKEMRAAGEL